MRKPSFLDLASLLIATAIFVLGSSFDASATKKCITIGQKSVCFDDGKGKGNNDDANTGANGGGDQGNGENGGGGDQGNVGGGGNQGDAPKAESKALDCSKAQCDAGEVKLDKPSKYGACCAPAEGFCPPDRPKGTPPNCCAEGTTFREGACWPDTCGPGTVGTPPHCQRTCGPGKVLVDQTCYDPCPAGTIGTPPDCRCPDGQVWDAGAKACKDRPKCTGGMVGTPPDCQCPPKTILKDGTCQACAGDRVVVDGKCQCPKGTGVYQKECRKCWGGRESVNGHCKCPVGKMGFPDPDESNCVRGTQVRCVWRGTAPFCDGSCEPGEVQEEHTYDQNHVLDQSHTGFGKSCSSGNKVYCCSPQ